MPSLVWGRSPQEAYENPYEYAAQEQFVREANTLLWHLNKGLQKYSMKFHLNDNSATKAIWMLQLDALDSLRDALEALENKKHRVAVKLFRDVVETLDLAAFFHSGTPTSAHRLQKWYEDKVISNSEYRDFVSKTEGEEAANAKRDYYKTLSRFTHRTYSALLNGYGRGRGDMIWHDGYSDSGMLVPPQTISAYLAVLADLIIEFWSETVKRNLLTSQEVYNALEVSLETETVPRRFVPRLPRQSERASGNP